MTTNGFGNLKNRTLPPGMTVSIFYLKDLINNYKYSKKKDLLEHPSLYFYREGRKKYHIKNYSVNKFLRRKYKIRLTIDTKKDYKFGKILFNKIYKKFGLYFSYKQILNILDKNKEILKINSDIKQKKINLISNKH